MAEQEEVKQIVVDAIQGEGVEGLAGSEASLSSNFKYTVPIKLGDGSVQHFDVQMTVRGIPIPAHIAAHIDAVVDACIVAMGHGGFTRAGDNVSSPSFSAPVQSTSALPTVGDDTSAVPQEAIGLNDGEDEAFDVEELIVSIDKGKMGFKIAGGKWKKFGVRVWDEVLEAAGVKIDKLEAKVYKMAGWRAYVKMEDGKPKKVTRLEKKG